MNSSIVLFEEVQRYLDKLCKQDQEQFNVCFSALATREKWIVKNVEQVAAQGMWHRHLGKRLPDGAIVYKVNVPSKVLSGQFPHGGRTVFFVATENNMRTVTIINVGDHCHSALRPGKSVYLGE